MGIFTEIFDEIEKLYIDFTSLVYNSNTYMKGGKKPGNLLTKKAKTASKKEG